MRSCIKAFILLSGSLFASWCHSQQPQVFNDMLTQQLHQELTASLTVQQDPQIIKAEAKVIRARYEALIQQGFTKEQALTLVAATLSRRD